MSLQLKLSARQPTRDSSSGSAPGSTSPWTGPRDRGPGLPPHLINRTFTETTILASSGCLGNSDIVLDTTSSSIGTLEADESPIWVRSVSSELGSSVLDGQRPHYNLLNEIDNLTKDYPSFSC